MPDRDRAANRQAPMRRFTRPDQRRRDAEQHRRTSPRLAQTFREGAVRSLLGTKTSLKAWMTRSRSATETTYTRAGGTGGLLFQPTARVAKRSRLSRPKDRAAD